MLLKAFGAIGLCLVSLAISTACSSPKVECAGTGVSHPGADVSVDVGDLLQPEAAISLGVGQLLFVGSNSCGAYGLPSAGSVAPELREVSRHQQAAPGTGDGTDTLAVIYQATNPGRVVISINCSNDCPGSPIRVNVTVAEPSRTAVSLISQQPTSAVIKQYGGLNDNPPRGLRKSAQIDDKVAIGRLVEDLNALPAYPSGTIYCPFDDGSYYSVDFRYANGANTLVRLEARGCQGLYVGGSKQPVAWALPSQGIVDYLVSQLA